MSQPKIAAIEQALLDAVASDATISAYVRPGQVHTLSERDLDAGSGELVVVPPAVLVWYLGGRYLSRVIQATTYEIDHGFLVVAVASNLRGAAQAKRGGVGSEKGVYDILDDLKRLLGGKKLTLSANTHAYCYLGGDGFEGITRRGDFAYGLEVRVRGVWQNP